jgi:hypothetical protein
MKKIIIILIISFISLIFFILSSNDTVKQNDYFNKVELSYNNQIVNNLLPSFYDTILSVGLDLYNIESSLIIVNPLSEESKAQFGGESLKAHIRYYNGAYYLFIDRLNRSEAMLVISHEIVHIKQYQNYDLIYENNILMWKGEVIDADNMEYLDRPWERDAFFNESKLYSQIHDKLYD